MSLLGNSKQTIFGGFHEEISLPSRKKSFAEKRILQAENTDDGGRGGGDGDEELRELPDWVTVISKDMCDGDVFDIWKIVKEGLDKGLSGVVSASFFHSKFKWIFELREIFTF